LTVFADGHDIPPDIQADLARRNIPVVDGRIVEIAHHKGHITTVNLDTRRNIAVDILFAHPRNKPSASLHESLGLATLDTPVGIALKVDERRQTSMPGIYAAGDLATPSCLGHPCIIAGRDGGYLRPAVDAGLRAQIPFSGCRGLSHSGSHRWIPGVKWTDACRPGMRAGVAVTSHAGLMTAASTKSLKSIEQARGGYTCCGG
jgi:hypothetical protein